MQAHPDPVLADELTAVRRMPSGSAQVEAARDLWEKARHSPNPAFRFAALDAAITAAVFGGAAHYGIALFPLLMDLRRMHPGAVSAADYAWRLKWIVGHLPEYPEIPRARIEQACNEYTGAVLEAGGMSGRTTGYVRFLSLVDMRDAPAAREAYEAFRYMPRDQHGDCAACEANVLVRYSILAQDWSAVRAAAAPIVRGTLSCAEIPHLTFALLLLPALRAGDFPFAAQCSLKGQRLISNNVDFLAAAGSHCLYLAFTRDAAALLRLLKRHTPWLRTSGSPQDHFYYCMGAAAGCRMLADTGLRKKDIHLQMPDKYCREQGDAAAPVSMLADWFAKEARALAAAFDRRNGNTAFTDELAAAFDVAERGLPSGI